ncbi:hypothetical protein EVAR_35933_1 [Eumeta japonica]|uniref:Uncharacterized protein n=1 Tax=Eumeta variegata TaxID=151549 RepID=A0A4C1W2C5_EUMVA|nr:hypothetical protein EVAR_35933_1 [Eumeta japonica]
MKGTATRHIKQPTSEWSLLRFPLFSDAIFRMPETSGLSTAQATQIGVSKSLSAAGVRSPNSRLVRRRCERQRPAHRWDIPHYDNNRTA